MPEFELRIYKTYERRPKFLPALGVACRNRSWDLILASGDHYTNVEASHALPMAAASAASIVDGIGLLDEDVWRVPVLIAMYHCTSNELGPSRPFVRVRVGAHRLDHDDGRPRITHGRLGGVFDFLSHDYPDEQRARRGTEQALSARTRTSGAIVIPIFGSTHETRTHTWAMKRPSVNHDVDLELAESFVTSLNAAGFDTGPNAEAESA